MSTAVTLLTKDGRIVHGINYTVSSSSLPSGPAALAAQMPGGMAYGVYHIHDELGWRYIPATNIAAVISVSAGAQT